MAEVREATADDLPRLVEMGRKFYDAAAWAGLFVFDPAGVEAFCQGLIDAETGILLVSEAGMAGSVVAPMYFNPAQLYCQELFWWSEDGHGSALWRALEDAARAKGAKVMAMACLHGLRHEAVSKLYRRAGYRPTEHFFMKGL